jgi:hypothetical protein
VRQILDKVEDAIFSRGAAQVTGWLAFVLPIPLWPLSSLTILKDEPQGVLALSWLAIMYGGYQVLQNLHTHRIVNEDA